MSLRREQYYSLKITKEFLRELLFKKGYINKTKLRKDIRRCLRHFPFLDENGKPLFSKDNWDLDDEDTI